MGTLGAGCCSSFEWKKWIGCLTANIVGGVDQLHCLFVYLFLSLMCHSLKCTNMEDLGKYSIFLESCLFSDPQYHSIVPSGGSRYNSFSTLIWSLQTSNSLPIHTNLHMDSRGWPCTRQVLTSRKWYKPLPLLTWVTLPKY